MMHFTNKGSYSRFAAILALAGSCCLGASAAMTPDDSLNTQVITNPETGELISGLYRSGIGAYYYFGAGESKPVDGEEGRLVIDGSDIYIFNPVISGITNTWVVGHIDGEGNVSVPTPQLVSGGPDDGFAYYLLNGVFDDQTLSATVNEEVTDIRYTYVDGVLTLAEGNPALFEYTVPTDIMGDPVEGEPVQWVWSGDIEFADQFRPYPHMGEEAPASLVVAPYVLYSQSEGVTEGRPVEGGFDGDTFWVRGLEPNVPKAWVKGMLADGKVTFTSQYICFDETQHLFQFLLPARPVVEDGMTVGYEVAENVVMDYDAAAGTLTASEDAVLFVNAGTESIYALSRYEAPRFRPETTLTTCVPANPVIIEYLPYSYEGDYGYVNVALPQVNVAGEYLNPDRMYYSLYENDEVMEISSPFFPDMEDTLWEIPYWYGGGSIFPSGVVHSISFAGPISDLGVKLIYYDGEGEAYESEIVRADGSSVETVGTREVASVIYTDLNGIRVASNATGLLIRTTVYTDGTRSVAKILKRN